eukprot:3167920-Amphidinium_carterae.1
MTYLPPREYQVYHLLFADDGALLAGGQHFFLKLLFQLLVLDLVEVPLSWMKLRGGLTSAWIGYEFDLKELGVGISAAKVEWVTGWIQRASVDPWIK